MTQAQFLGYQVSKGPSSIQGCSHLVQLFLESPSPLVRIPLHELPSQVGHIYDPYSLSGRDLEISFDVTLTLNCHQARERVHFPDVMQESLGGLLLLGSQRPL